MIKNIIFDMGNVLIKYDPKHFIARTGIEDAGDRELLFREIFCSEDWALTDAGQIDEAELFHRICLRVPEKLHRYVHELVFHWNEPIEPIPGMADFIRECKKSGFGIYLLSNASVRQGEYWPKVPGSECFDGRIVSGDVKCVKPEAEIFQNLIHRYGLIPEECVFIDDVAANVDGARRIGMHGIVFEGDMDAFRLLFSKTIGNA